MLYAVKNYNFVFYKYFNYNSILFLNWKKVN
jgi:hypothetical protein